jgi:hypothetical protein
MMALRLMSGGLRGRVPIEAIPTLLGGPQSFPAYVRSTTPHMTLQAGKAVALHTTEVVRHQQPLQLERDINVLASRYEKCLPYRSYSPLRRNTKNVMLAVTQDAPRDTHDSLMRAATMAKNIIRTSMRYVRY